MCSDLCGSPCVWGYVGLCTHSARKPQFQCFLRENGWNRQKDQPLNRFTPFLLQWHSLLECTRFTYQWYNSDQYVVRYVRFALKSGVHTKTEHAPHYGQASYSGAYKNSEHGRPLGAKLRACQSWGPCSIHILKTLFFGSVSPLWYYMYKYII